MTPRYNEGDSGPGRTWQILHTRTQQRSPEIIRRVAGILAQRDLSSGEYDRFRQVRQQESQGGGGIGHRV